MALAPARPKMMNKPIAREFGHFFQRTWFPKEMCRAGDNLQFHFAAHAIPRHFVQFNYNVVVATDDEQRRRLDLWQCVAGKIGPSTT